MTRRAQRDAKAATTGTYRTVDQADAPVLPPSRAFVIQLAADADPSHEDLRGRVEHVASGRATSIGSGAELLAFLARVLESQPGASGAQGPIPLRPQDPADDGA